MTVNDAASLDLASAMIFEMWVRLSALGGWGTVLMKERPAACLRIGTNDQPIAGRPLAINP